MARSSIRSAQPVVLVVVAFVLLSCSTPEIIRETPQPDATVMPTLVPVETQIPPTTVIVNTPEREIEQIALATRVDDTGAPKDERSAIPEAAESFYLCVQVRQVSQGSRFQAIWFEGDEILGRSEKLALEDAAEPVWIAMQYRPVAQLNPARTHAVELVIDNELIERLVFRVGIGEATDAIAAAAFTTGFDVLGKPVSPQTYFRVDTPQLTLRVRISNQVDPVGMLFTTLWYRGDTQIGQRAPDAGSTDPRRVNFTFSPASPLAIGDYRVALLLNGAEVRSIPFVVTNGDIPTPAPSQTPSTEVEVAEIVVSNRIDTDSRAPIDGPIEEWKADAGTVAKLWIALDVRRLTESDTIEIVVLQDEEFYGSVTLDEANVDSAWLAERVELDVPIDDETTFEYTFSVRVNGDEQTSAQLEISAES